MALSGLQGLLCAYVCVLQLGIEIVSMHLATERGGSGALALLCSPQFEQLVAEWIVCSVYFLSND